MRMAQRLQYLQESIKSLVKITGFIHGEGIALRWLNYKTPVGGRAALMEPMNLKEEKEVERLIQDIKPHLKGPTKLGHSLREKVLEKLLYRKVEEETLTKPLLVTIITDGEV